MAAQQTGTLFLPRCLVDIVETKFGLLDELRRCGVLNKQQIGLIEDEGSHRKQVFQLLKIVEQLSQERQHQFLSALDRTQQCHVSNYIRNNGIRPSGDAEDQDNWPIYELEQWHILQQNRKRLKEVMDPRFGLLEDLLSEGCIDTQQKQCLCETTSINASIETLLMFIERGSIENYNKFIACLKKSNQHHVVALLEPNIPSKCDPLSQKHRSILIHNYSALAKIIEPEGSGLLPELLSHNVITSQQKEYIESAVTRVDRNNRLLDIVLRGSEQNFHRFIACLNATRQLHVSTILRDGLVIGNITAITSDSTNLLEHEKQIVDNFESLMAAIKSDFMATATTDSKQQICAKLRRCFKEVKLIAMQPAHSIKLFCVCASLSELMYLNELYTSGKLKSIIQQIFTMLSDNKQLVTVDRLVWNMSDYINCVQYLLNKHGLFHISRVYQLAQESSSDITMRDPSVSSMPLDQLPSKLIEQILIKAAGKLFLTMKQISSDADIYTCLTLHAVCKDWWRTFTRQQGLKQLIKRYFEQLSLPLKDPWLKLTIEINFGLLDELCDCGLLNQQQLKLLRLEETEHAKVVKLLDGVHKMSRDCQEQFLTALDKTQQSHVTNYIRNRGQRPVTDSENWPFWRDNLFFVVDENREKLRELLDIRSGLLEELSAVECINEQQKQFVCKQRTNDDCNIALLDIIIKKSSRDFKKFVICLEKTKQHRVLAILSEPNSSTSSPPVSEKRVRSLTANYNALAQLIDLNKGGFLKQIISAEVVSLRQKVFIESAKTQSESNKRLLDILKNGSEQNFNNFVECLRETGQENLASVLSSDGVVVEMVAHPSLPVTEEFDVLNQFSNMIDSVLVSKDGYDFERIAMPVIESDVKLFILCRSLLGLLHCSEVYEILSSKIQHIPIMSLDKDQLVMVNRLEWKMSDYGNGASYFFNAHGLSISYQIYHLAQQSPYCTYEPSNSSQLFAPAPYEVIEVLLIKAAVKLFVILKAMTSRADVITLTTIHTVCSGWRKILTNRQPKRDLLRKYFEQLCTPHRCNPKLVCSQHIQDGSLAAVGIAELNNKLYIATEESDTIVVLPITESSYSEPRDHLRVSKLRCPMDIVGYKISNCLYVSDYETRCIWQVNLPDNETKENVKKFIITGYEPHTLSLSVQSRSLLVTAYNGRSLFVYNCDKGELIREICLFPNADIGRQGELSPCYSYPRHAIEISGQTFIVSHSEFSLESKIRPEIRKVSNDGRVLRVYEGRADFNRPCYMTVSSEKHILVCDRQNKQIVHLNRQLELIQILLSHELRGQPRRLLYNEEKRLLYVTYKNFPQVDAFRI